ncbi:MAG: hypothetical protein MJZ41_04375 [Bacteroidaceae bacterium]|nr:hypothetical protein [Bacteroidaceae bacterium]
MNKKMFFAVLMTMLFCFTTVKADVYSEGLTKLLDSGIVSNIDIADLQEQFKKSGVNVSEEYLNGKFKTDVAELLASYYRDNMSERDFALLMDYVSNNPDYAESMQKIAKAQVAANNEMSEIVVAAALMIALGGKPEAVAPIESSTDYKKAFDKYAEVIHLNESTESVMIMLKKMFEEQVSDNDAEGRENMNRFLGSMIDYVKQNMPAIIFNKMVGKVDVGDYETVSAIQKEPFYGGYIKSADAIIADLPNFLNALMQKIVAAQ